GRKAWAGGGASKTWRMVLRGRRTTQRPSSRRVMLKTAVSRDEERADMASTEVAERSDEQMCEDGHAEERCHHSADLVQRFGRVEWSVERLGIDEGLLAALADAHRSNSTRACCRADQGDAAATLL